MTSVFNSIEASSNSGNVTPDFTLSIGFVTSGGFPTLSEDDQILINLASLKKIRFQFLVWDDESVDWSSEKFDVLIIRSLWDYVLKVDKFKKWIDYIQSLGIRVLNDLGAIRWNIDKNYLDEFQNINNYLYNNSSKSKKQTSSSTCSSSSSLSNIKIIPTIFIRPNEKKSLLKSIEEGKKSGRFSGNQKEFVFKPCIGAGGYGTTKFHLDSHEEYKDSYMELLEKSDVLLQPFISTIHDQGETSFIFFNGKFSHSIIKRPSKNDFRVQEGYGGTVEKNPNPPLSEIQLAQSIMDRIIEKHPRILYARIDMLRYHDGKLFLSECEIFEPTLYFMGDQDIAIRFLDCVIEMIAQEEDDLKKQNYVPATSSCSITPIPSPLSNSQNGFQLSSSSAMVHNGGSIIPTTAPSSLLVSDVPILTSTNTTTTVTHHGGSHSFNESIKRSPSSSILSHTYKEQQREQNTRTTRSASSPKVSYRFGSPDSEFSKNLNNLHTIAL
ncbi:hypothetical protein DLAC_09174 [Tieghemostelium lacteum]|uniref:Prokaryotic glutathione synthetase ATP-binding domain-containing protein n=1 Tax=Tieghemostelium lacteum TaxID=361077 RepID=A0A151Z9C3_TIELA|nr:hypothetical protein DLAC_09174 [Tieghemostelium lacteum]|eukprot:KYQ90549.1 hypothetical protein DLAC_09174 [Tieghemostelium lacteum]